MPRDDELLDLGSWLPDATRLQLHLPYDYLPPLNRGRFFDPLVGPTMDLFRELPLSRDGGMADTAVSKSAAAKHPGSSPGPGTK
jgi:hypothetical protein